MKILMFGWEYPPHISGGLGTACYGLTKGLTSLQDTDVTFVIPKAHGDEYAGKVNIIGAGNVKLSPEAARRIRAIKQSLFSEPNPQITSYTSPELYEKLMETIAIQQKTLCKTKGGEKVDLSGGYGATLFDEIHKFSIVAGEIAANESHDIIHAHDWLTFQAGIRAKHTSGKPLVIHVHATEYDRSGENHNKTVFRMEQDAMRKADKIIAVSDLTRNTIINKYHITSSKIITIYNAVEPVDTDKIRNPWKIGTTDRIVTFLGRITYQKGPEFFIEAACKVLKRMDNVRFIMAGSGDLMNKMIAHVSRLHISDKFHFTGFLKGDDVYRMLCASDLFIMPSVSEPFGIAPLEAIQSKVPVIISKQSGVAEVLKNSIKVDFWDVNAIADAIYAILNYSALRKYLVKNGKTEVENMKWDNAAANVRNVYNELLKTCA